MDRVAEQMMASGTTAGALLEVQGVYKAFGRNQVLRGVDLTVHAGETVAVVGENGSGKSVLLKILAGLERPDRGMVRLGQRIGYCPQRLELFEGLTVSENLIYFGAAYGLSEQPLREAGRYYLERFRYERYVDTLVKNLSEGTKQKLNLTIALLHAPGLLLLDEPYQGFDYETFLNFAGLLSEWRSQNRAVLTISHLVTADLPMDRILEMREGTLHVAQAAPDRL
jgi:ABC-type multidrug transport system ATPase subunit